MRLYSPFAGVLFGALAHQNAVRSSVRMETLETDFYSLWEVVVDVGFRGDQVHFHQHRSFVLRGPACSSITMSLVQWVQRVEQDYLNG